VVKGLNAHPDARHPHEYKAATCLVYFVHASSARSFAHGKTVEGAFV
jgi:hypothetical protein